MDAVLLDTDILNEVLKRRNSVVVAHAVSYLAAHAQFAFSAITRYEVARGLRERNALAQLNVFESFCARSVIYSVSDAILDRTTELWVAARRGGQPCRDADLIIAATALETSRTLVTGNTAHFARIPMLKLLNWRDP